MASVPPLAKPAKSLQSSTQKYSKNFYVITKSGEDGGDKRIFKCITQLLDSDIIRLLKQKRSKLFLQMLPTAVEKSSTRTILSDNLFSWPNREAIMANVLLGPFIYNIQRGKPLLTAEDELDENISSASSSVFCSLSDTPNFDTFAEQLGDFGISYSSWQIVVNSDIGKQTFLVGKPGEETFLVGKYNIYQYKYPEEKDIIAYLRQMRKAYAPRSRDEPSSLEWILYHNILTRYLFPEQVEQYEMRALATKAARDPINNSAKVYSGLARYPQYQSTLYQDQLATNYKDNSWIRYTCPRF